MATDPRSETTAGELEAPPAPRCIACGSTFGRSAAATRWWNSPRRSLYNAVVLPSSRLAAARPLAGSSRAGWLRIALAIVLAAAPASAIAAPPSASGPDAKAGAQTKPAAKPAAKPATKTSPEPAGRTGPGGKKVISLDDEFLVEGQLEKPSAFYVLQRSSTDYDWARLDATMTPLVLESVWDPLF